MLGSGVRIDPGPASATAPGYITTGTQTIAGVKTFTSSPVIAKNASSTLGNSRFLDLKDTLGSSGVRTEIGWGYMTGATYPPVVTGHIPSSVAGLTKGGWYIASRDVTTDTAPTLRFLSASDGRVTIAQGGAAAGSATIHPNNVLTLAKSMSGLSTVGVARAMALENTSGSANELVEIGFGYAANATTQPVVIGHKVTSASGSTKGSFYIAVRDVTTDTAPTECVTVASDASVTLTGALTLGLRANLKSYTVATLPAAGVAGGLAYVSDAAVAPCVAFSNGTNWKRCDNAATTVV